VRESVGRGHEIVGGKSSWANRLDSITGQDDRGGTACAGQADGGSAACAGHVNLNSDAADGGSSKVEWEGKEAGKGKGKGGGWAALAPSGFCVPGSQHITPQTIVVKDKERRRQMKRRRNATRIYEGEEEQEEQEEQEEKEEEGGGGVKQAGGFKGVDGQLPQWRVRGNGTKKTEGGSAGRAAGKQQQKKQKQAPLPKR